MEEWRTIVGFPNYSVSSYGRVYNKERNRILSEFYTYGYAHVQLYHEGMASTKKIHRLVAEAFLYQPDGLTIVNHIDGDRSYNNVDNLEWCTQSDNIKHAYANGQKYATNKKKVRIIETGEEFDSLSSCAHAINGDVSGVSMCLTGQLKTHRGYTFEPLEEVTYGDY
jgi:hypothetical protein